MPLGDNWHWHTDHGFFWSVPDNSPASIFFYAMDYGWIWTANDMYPFIYRFEPAAWLYYLEDSFNPRAFYNYETFEWEYY